MADQFMAGLGLGAQTGLGRERLDLQRERFEAEKEQVTAEALAKEKQALDKQMVDRFELLSDSLKNKKLLSADTRYQNANKAIKVFNYLAETKIPPLSREEFDSKDNIVTNTITKLSALSRSVKEGKTDPVSADAEALKIAGEAFDITGEKQALIEQAQAGVAAAGQQAQQQQALEKLVPGQSAIKAGITAGGAASELATEAAKRQMFPETPKQPTVTTAQGRFLTDALAGKVDFNNLTQGQQFVMGTLQKGGFNLEFDPETGRLLSIASGTAKGKGDTSTPTPAFKTQIQKETDAAVRGVQGFQALREKVTPESFGVTSKLAKAVQEVFEFFAPGSTPKNIAETTRSRDKLFRQVNESFAMWVKQLTGVQFGEKEATRLKKGFPNQDDNFAEFNNKLDDIEDSYYRAVARMKRFNNPTDQKLRQQVINSVPLGAITDEEVEAVRAEFSPQQTATDLSTLSDEELLRQLEQ